jgi:hypothetical protein
VNPMLRAFSMSHTVPGAAKLSSMRWPYGSRPAMNAATASCSAIAAGPHPAQSSFSFASSQLKMDVA